MLPPGVAGFDPATGKRQYDPVAAAALLDRLGYAKRDAQGYRLAPDGKPLTLTLTIFPGTVWREIQTLLRKNMDSLGLRMEFRSVPTQDLFKEAAQGKFMLNIHGRSATPNGLGYLVYYGPSPGEANETRFRSEAYDRALEAFLRAANDNDRQRAARTMNEILRDYAPVIPLLIDIENAFVQPWVQGYFPSSFSAYYQYLDIDTSRPH
jgi:ABC-type transport system substrate-binding protein